MDKTLVCIIDLTGYLQSIYLCENNEDLKLVDSSTIPTLKQVLLKNSKEYNVNKIHLFGLDNYVQELRTKLNETLFNKKIKIEVN